MKPAFVGLNKTPEINYLRQKSVSGVHRMCLHMLRKTFKLPYIKLSKPS